MSPRKKDLTGQRFGRLTALYEADPWYTSGGNKKVMWHCVCDCGNEKDIASGDLRNGHTMSCGCLNKDVVSSLMSEKNKRFNDYDLSGDYGIGYTLKGEEFWFDKEDYDLIKGYCWFKHHGYFVAKIPNSKPMKSITLHGLIMNNVDSEYITDHIKTEYKHDNRKRNLRFVSRKDNNKNHRIAINNTSGVTGVSWRNDIQKWRAQIGINNQKINLGEYLDFNDAVLARKQAEEKYFKDMSYDNSQKKYKEEINNG